MGGMALIREAVDIAGAGIEHGESPFGAVIAAASGKVIARAHNTVRSTTDPTAHAEISAIREACASLGTIDLSAYVIATTCEPCPMCAAAIHWARLNTILFGATIADAQAAGFRELVLPCQSVLAAGGRGSVRVCGGLLRNECVALFDRWRLGPNPVPY